MKIRKQYLYYAIGLFIGLVILTIFHLPDGKARLIACDVGQGDALLVTQGYTQILVDGGPSSEKILACLTRHIPFWDRHIDLIVLTNTDFDHINGLSTVLERYSTSNFVTADGVRNSDAVDRFRSIVHDSRVPIHATEQGETIRVGTQPPVVIDILWPPDVIHEYVAVLRDKPDTHTDEQILGASAKRGDLNERSVVALITIADYKILLTGDSGFQTEEELLERHMLSDIDILKVGHHGSRYATSLEFLKWVDPEIAIISVGSTNRYGHPTEETLERLQSIGAQILRTDTTGDVVIELSGKTQPQTATH